MSQYEAIVIGTSAGGLDALSVILSDLPAGNSLPVIVVQHRAAESGRFVGSYFNNRVNIAVKEADYGEPICAGTVYFAPAGYHLHVESDRTLRLSVDEPVKYSRPSIDVLFRSAADVYGDRLVGVVLTGANDDGAEGARHIQRQGGLVLVQDPATAYMAQMPRAVLQTTQADHVMSLKELGSFLGQLSGQSADKNMTSPILDENSEKRDLSSVSLGREEI